MTSQTTYDIVHPKDCAFIVGLPESKVRFERALVAEGGSYVRSFWGGWPQYQVQFANVLAKFAARVEHLGALVVREATLSTMSDVLASRKPKVLILLSHWGSDSVEFADGFETVPKIAQAIPDTFEGVVDLCVCHPNSLAITLRSSRRNVLVRFTPQPVRPLAWFAYFETLSELLATGRYSYSQAYEMLNTTMMRQAQ